MNKVRCFIYLSYDGTPFHGWQVQPNGVSVQGELQQALSLLLHEQTNVVGAGRTDTGVHARLMVAHCDLPGSTDLQQLCYRLNGILPPEIAIDRIVPVADDAHARFSARSRTYHYYIHTRKSPFLRHYSNELTYRIDFQAMNEAAAYLLEVSDFAAFCKVGSDQKTTICHVSEARWIEMDEPGRWYFTITANRFLRNMVRAVVGTLILVGRGKISLDDFRAIIASGQRTLAGDSMPGNALFLWDVSYDKPPIEA